MQHVHQCQLETARSKVCTKRPYLSAFEVCGSIEYPIHFYTFILEQIVACTRTCVFRHTGTFVKFMSIKFFFETSLESVSQIPMEPNAGS
jgi:hypothetical protein